MPLRRRPVRRARQGDQGSFELTPENADAVAAVCRRLDGLPLALELAAARLRLLSPEALLERLDHALDVLTSGPRDTPERQQTLRATIDWSHSLLDESEQRLFRRMAVFAGGCTLADVEAVCAEPGETVLDELESLVDKALVQIGRPGRPAPDAADDRRVRRASGSRPPASARGRAEARPPVRGARAGRSATASRAPIRSASLERGIAEEGNLQAALDTLLAAARDGDALACEAGPADVRRPVLVLAHPRQEPHRPGVRRLVPRRRYRAALRPSGERAR